MKILFVEQNHVRVATGLIPSLLKTRLSFHKCGQRIKRSDMALIANESEDVVFEERECSLDLLVSFSIKGKGKRINVY